MTDNVKYLAEARFRRSLLNVQSIHDPITVVRAYFDCARQLSSITDDARRAKAAHDLSTRVKGYADWILDVGYDGDEDMALEDPRVIVLGFALDVCREVA